MTPAQFFETFDLLSDLPNAVGKMRELILDLAVRGRLVPPDLGYEGVVGTFAPIPDDDIPFSIPENWRWTRLGDIYLSSFYGPRFGKDEYVENGVPTIRTTDMTIDGKIVLRNPPMVRLDDRKKFEQYCLQKNDLLVTRSGTIGMMAVFNEDYDAIPSAYLIRLRFPHFVLAAFYYLYLKSFHGQELLGLSLRSIGVPNVNAASISKFPAPLPPLAEQKRIVAKVDELMALCDRLEAQQKQREAQQAALVQASLTRFTDAPTPTNLEFLFHKSYAVDPAELRKTILTLAVQGKLVPQNYCDETATNFLIRSHIRGNEPGDDAITELSGNLPASWTMVRFEEIALIAGGVTLGRKFTGKKMVNLPYLRVANVKRGEIDISDVKEVSIGEDEIERYALKNNDLLMIEGGDWDKVGRAAIWDARIPLCLHQNHVFRARMKNVELMPIWIERYFNSPIGRQYFENAAKQTTNLASINMRQVRACPIPLPPLAEQKRIVAKVEELMGVVDRLEAQLAASREVGAKLIEAVVAEIAAAA